MAFVALLFSFKFDVLFTKYNYFYFSYNSSINLGYCNLILINKIFNKESFKSFKFLNFISLISIIFINIFFYRLAEHGTDRSGMIIVIISVILFFKSN